MHQPLHTILKRLRQDLDRHLDPDSIRDICKSIGHTWRNSILNPVNILHLFLLQILHQNTSLEHVSLLAERRFTGSAYCQARARLPLIFFQEAARRLVASLVAEAHDPGLWRGHRVVLIDGSGLSMPDTPVLQKHFGQPTNQARGCGFPVAKILAVFHAATGLLVEIAAAPLRSHDMSQAGRAHPHLRSGDVLVADRGFCSFPHLAMLVRGGIHAVFRIHQKQIVDFTPNRPHTANRGKSCRNGLPRSRWLRGLGVSDQVVEWIKPERRPAWMTAAEFAALPATLIVRELRYDVAHRGYRTKKVTLVTTLLDGGLYPFEELARLYGVRWRVELNLRHMKTTMRMDILKSTTVDGVLKEMTMYGMAYNLICATMAESARARGVEVDRISFVDVQRWLVSAEVGEELARFVVNRSRPGRIEPRVRKRRPKQYPLMKKTRAELRNALLTKDVAA